MFNTEAYVLEWIDKMDVFIEHDLLIELDLHVVLCLDYLVWFVRLLVGLVVGWFGCWLVGFGTAHYNCLYRSDESSDFMV